MNFFSLDCKNNMMKKRKGFTLVELSLSMVFIATLSIIITLLINGMVSSYRRGMTLNLLNTVGSELINEIRTAVQGSPLCGGVGGLCENVSWESYHRVNNEDVPVSGAFCTGKYSYIWNSGYFFDNDYANNEGFDKNSMVKIVDSGGRKIAEGFKLVKVEDSKKVACQMSDGDRSIRIDGVEEADVQNVLDETNSGVAIYNLNVDPPASGGKGGELYWISLTLGTAQSGMKINSVGGECATPSEDNSNPDYCAINIFNFAALANGGR